MKEAWTLEVTLAINLKWESASLKQCKKDNFSKDKVYYEPADFFLCFGKVETVLVNSNLGVGSGML